MRGHFESGIHQHTTLSFCIAERPIDNFIEESLYRIARRPPSKSSNPIPEALLDVEIQRSSIDSSLVSKRVVNARSRQTHRLGEVAN